MTSFLSKQSSSRQGASQNVAFNASGGASAASTAFGSQTYQIMISASSTGFIAGSGGVRVRIGDGTPSPAKAIPKSVPPVQRPGASAPRSSRADNDVRSLNSRLQQSGSVKDAVQLLMARRAAAKG
jgi:hypothetical protein